MKFCVGEPAAVVGKNLVVSDAHVGMELELQAKGIEVSNYEREARRLNALLKQSRCNRIIVLGDFKHDFYGFKNKEFWILKKFLRLLECKDITVIKGNHDSQLEEFEDVNVVDSKGMLLEAGGVKYGLFHGHDFPSREITERQEVGFVSRFRFARGRGCSKQNARFGAVPEKGKRRFAEGQSLYSRRAEAGLAEKRLTLQCPLQPRNFLIHAAFSISSVTLPVWFFEKSDIICELACKCSSS